MNRQDTLSRLKQQERQARENLILDAARKVFGTRSYDKVSMSEIAKAAGMAKSSIYTYFPNQEALFVEAALQDTEHFINALERLLDGAQDPLQTAIEAFLDHYTEHEAQWRMITRFALHGNISHPAAEKLDGMGRRLMDLFETVAGQAGFIEEGRLMAHMLFATLSGILISFRKYPGRSERQRRGHMQRLGRTAAEMLKAYQKVC